MSCGRPASLTIEDLDVELPDAFYDRVSNPIIVTVTDSLTTDRLSSPRNHMSMIRDMLLTFI